MSHFPHLFDAIRRTDAAGNNYWSSRDLATLLGYENYRNFEPLLESARSLCAGSGHRIQDHFIAITEMVAIGNGAQREIASVKLSRYACYLIAQQADPAKESVAQAQTYFAQQTNPQLQAERLRPPPEIPALPRIKKISVSGYRAFPPYKPNSLEIDLGDTGKNLLLYGENGSGKTSLFRALRDLFDTSPAARDYITVRNIFHQDEDDSVVVSLTSGTPDEYRWEVGEPHPKSTGDSFQAFARSCLFLEYRDLLQTNFVHRTGAPNLFDLLVKVVLPELPAPTSPLRELHQAMVDARPRGRKTKNPIRRANEKAAAFKAALTNNLPELVRETNRLLELLQPRTAIQLNPPEQIIYAPQTGDFIGQTLTLGVELNGIPVAEPQHFLNEARLTAIALALYLAAARLTRVGRPGIMVLDDVLIGLDLSNRVPLLQLLQTEFANWQILLLTHNHVWFDLAREYTEHGGAWEYREMYLVPGAHGASDRPDIRASLNALERAEAHLGANDYMAAAVYLRAAFEAKIRNACETQGIEIPFKKQLKDVKADALWSGLVTRQTKREDLQRSEPGRNHPDFIPQSLIQRVEMVRSTILNRLSHADAPTFGRTEIETARDTLRDLHNHQFQRSR